MTLGLAKPILIGRPSVIEMRLQKLGLKIEAGKDFEVVNNESDPRFKEYWNEYYQIMKRRGVSPLQAVIGNPTLIGAIMVRRGEADSLICGTIGDYKQHYDIVEKLFGFRADVKVAPSIILGGQTVNEDTQQNTGSASGQKTIIAAQTLVHGDLRFLSDKQKCMAEQKMHEIMETSLPLTSSQLIFNNIMPAMLEKNENRQLLAELSDISVTLGGSSLQAVQTTERGGADISYIAQYAAASLDGLGPWGRGTHSQNETLEVKSLPEVTKRAAIFISRHLD